jgi:hypothetical protein
MRHRDFLLGSSPGPVRASKRAKVAAMTRSGIAMDRPFRLTAPALPHVTAAGPLSHQPRHLAPTIPREIRKPDGHSQTFVPIPWLLTRDLAGALLAPSACVSPSPADGPKREDRQSSRGSASAALLGARAGKARGRGIFRAQVSSSGQGRHPSTMSRSRVSASRSRALGTGPGPLRPPSAAEPSTAVSPYSTHRRLPSG